MSGILNAVCTACLIVKKALLMHSSLISKVATSLGLHSSFEKHLVPTPPPSAASSLSKVSSSDDDDEEDDDDIKIIKVLHCAHFWVLKIIVGFNLLLYIDKIRIKKLFLKNLFWAKSNLGKSDLFWVKKITIKGLM